jgi:hypothetical protein
MRLSIRCRQAFAGFRHLGCNRFSIKFQESLDTGLKSRNQEQKLQIIHVGPSVPSESRPTSVMQQMSNAICDSLVKLCGGVKEKIIVQPFISNPEKTGLAELERK